MPVTEHATGLYEVLDPFPGLRPFEANEEAIFRGRQLHTDELLHRLASHRFLAVVGTSGSGKSSLVRAGLLPALDRGYLAGATSRWRVAVMRPGMAPIQNLADALRNKDALGTADEEQLRSTTLGLVHAVREAKLPAGESLLVVADQFEEIFRYQRQSMHDGGADAALFVRLLLTAARRPDVPVYVVLTMRSDFLGDCSQFPGLPEVLSESQYLIPRLTREQRRQAIEEPLRLFGAAMTPQLVEQLLNDSGDDADDSSEVLDYRGSAPDPLPVLQHALMRTFNYWKSLPADQMGDRIDLAHYRAVGRIESALDQHAEAVFNEGIPSQQGRLWAERIFRCITTTELARPIRRPTPLRDVYEIIGAGKEDRADVDSVLTLLHRRDNSFIYLNREETVDISHESLIWKWKRLGGWIRQEAASAETYADLVRDSKNEAAWGEPKLSSALAMRRNEAWNPHWARQYSNAEFAHSTAFLERSRIAVRNQAWLRRIAAGAVAAFIVLAIWTYKSQREVASLRVVRDGLQAELKTKEKEQGELRAKVGNLDASLRREGLTREERDRIAAEKTLVEEELKRSLEDSSRLTQATAEATTLQASVQSLQSRLERTQRDLASESDKRRAAESEAESIGLRLRVVNKDLSDAVSPRGLGAGAAIVSALRQLEKDNPHYRANLAMALSLSGGLYASTQRVKEAETAYLESLTIQKELAKGSPAKYLPDLALTLDRLGSLYLDSRRYSDSEAAHSQALKIWNDFLKDSRATYLLEVASTQSSLGLIYQRTGRSDLAVKTFSEAIAISNKHLATNPSIAGPLLANLLLNLGVALPSGSPAAERAYLESIAIYTELVKEDTAYLPTLALGLNNLAVVYDQKGRRKEQESALLTSLAAYRLLTKTKSSTELPDMALTLNNLGHLYRDTARVKEAAVAFSEAISIRRDLYKVNPSGFGDRLAGSLLNLADLIRTNRRDDVQPCSLATEAEQAARTDDTKNRASTAKKELCAGKAAE